MAKLTYLVLWSIGFSGLTIHHNSSNVRNQEDQRENDPIYLHQQQHNTLHQQRQPSTAEAALISSCMDGTEQYQKISEIGKGKHELI